MDVLLLSRVQFAATTYFHFLFVPLTLGLSMLTAIMETVWVRTGDEDYKRMTKFWGKLFLINFAVGVVTGITLEFQFGTNWSGYSAYVGDVFGSLLAIEATVAFFLESTFIGMWIFGWKRLSPRVHALAIWLVAIGANLSAVWILVANAWMQHPVGYVIRNGRAELTDFAAVVFQRPAIVEVLHTIASSWALAGFFVLGVSAWHLLRRRRHPAFLKSFRMAAVWTAIFSVGVALAGHVSAEDVAKTQPPKLAAMEGVWETTAHAPMYLLLWPDAANERNALEALPVPSALSILAGYTPDTVVQGLEETPVEDRPPVLATFLSFRAMVGLGVLMIVLAFLALAHRRDPGTRPWVLKVLVWSIPVPYIAIAMGWTVSEIGRQPWIVYEVLRTEDAVSNLALGQVATSLVGFFVVYGLLGAVDFYLLAKFARKGITGETPLEALTPGDGSPEPAGAAK